MKRLFVLLCLALVTACSRNSVPHGGSIPPGTHIADEASGGASSGVTFNPAPPAGYVRGFYAPSCCTPGYPVVQYGENYQCIGASQLQNSGGYFAAVDAAIAQARSKGARLGLALICPQQPIPQQLSTSTLTAFAVAAIKAVGSRYDGNPIIAWIEIGKESLFGASNSYPVIDAYVQAFPHTRLLMPTDDTAALLYGLKKSPAIGMHRESLGTQSFSDGLSNLPVAPADQDLIANRWQTAPLVAQPAAGAAKWNLGVYGMVSQVAQFHVASVADAFDDYNSLDDEQRSAIEEIGHISGYNTGVTDWALDASSPDAYSLNVFWATQRTPLYDLWKVSYSVKDASGNAVTINSHIDLRTWFDGVLTDTITIPKTAIGQPVSFAVKAIDPAGVRRPLTLASGTPLADGSYSFNL